MLVQLSLRRNLKNILHDNFHCAWHQHNRLARVLEQLSVGSLADGMDAAQADPTGLCHRRRRRRRDTRSADLKCVRKEGRARTASDPSARV